jgi:hypothetical protein
LEDDAGNKAKTGMDPGLSLMQDERERSPLKINLDGEKSTRRPELGQFCCR